MFHLYKWGNVKTPACTLGAWGCTIGAPCKKWGTISIKSVVLVGVHHRCSTGEARREQKLYIEGAPLVHGGAP